MSNRGKHVNSLNNLKKGPRLKKGERRTIEIARIGGKASSDLQQKRRTFKAMLLSIMDEPVPDNIARELKRNYGKNVDNLGQALALRVYMEGLETGSFKTFEAIRDTVGEKPTDKVESVVVNEYSRDTMRAKLLFENKTKPKKKSKKH